ncbi:MAG: SdrD B-like domain-containing protein, partial [Gaiellales bacterium]
GQVHSSASTKGKFEGSSTDSSNVGVLITTSANAQACVTYTYTENVLVCIGDYVWYDDNKDGIQDPNETGVAERSVTVVDANGTPMGTTRTDANGRWKICQLEPSTACVAKVDLPDGWNLTTPYTGTRATDSNGLPDGTDAQITDCLTPPEGEDLTFDVGIHKTPPTAAPSPRPAGKMRMSKVANRKSMASGSIVRYTVRVTNKGGRAIRNVRVCDTPPTQLAFTSKPRGAKLRNGQLCWTVKLLRAKKTASMRYTMRAANVPTRVCTINRVTAATEGSTSSARHTVCIRPTKLGLLKLAR